MCILNTHLGHTGREREDRLVIGTHWRGCCQRVNTVLKVSGCLTVPSGVGTISCEYHQVWVPS